MPNELNNMLGSIRTHIPDFDLATKIMGLVRSGHRADQGNAWRDIEKQVMTLIEDYGQYDGGHHKQWTLDQIARVIKGDGYKDWVVEMMDGEDGAETYTYDEGIAP